MNTDSMNGESTISRSGDSLDTVLWNWRELAAVAWEGYLTLGRGSVQAMDDGTSIVAEYRPGPPCECHADTVEAYDPATEAVIAVRRKGDEAEFSLHVLRGWPEPPAAYATVPGDEIGRVVQ